MIIEKVNKEFHAWLRDEAEGWIQTVALSDAVYQALKRAYEGGKQSQSQLTEQRERK